MAFQDCDGQKFSLVGVPVTVQSTHGAGDMFVETLAARIALGDSIQAALTRANEQAAMLVSTPEKDR